MLSLISLFGLGLRVSVEGGCDKGVSNRARLVTSVGQRMLVAIRRGGSRVKARIDDGCRQNGTGAADSKPRQEQSESRTQIADAGVGYHSATEGAYKSVRAEVGGVHCW